MDRAALSATTHTVVLSQLADLNARLVNHPHSGTITAQELNLTGARLLAGPGTAALPGSAVLTRLCWDGPPEYPYIHAHFGDSAGQGDGSQAVDLHTAALQQISHRLGVRQTWA